MQDPENLEVVYAGTTEGLYKTVNGGRTFARMTDSDVVINDVYVDPANSNRVLLATDRGGVLVSDDAGVTFMPSNQGISERKIAALLVDSQRCRGDSSMPAWSTTSNSAASSALSMPACTGSSSAPGSTVATCLRWPKPKMAPS